MNNLSEDIDVLRHDLKRGISAIHSGLTILNTSQENDDDNVVRIKSEMLRQCKSTLSLLENLFEEIEVLKTKGEL